MATTPVHTPAIAATAATAAFTSIQPGYAGGVGAPQACGEMLLRSPARVHLPDSEGSPRRGPPAASRTDRGPSVLPPYVRLDGLDVRRSAGGRTTAMRDAYHEELDAIGDRLVEMSRFVGSAIGRATTAIL